MFRRYGRLLGAGLLLFLPQTVSAQKLTGAIVFSTDNIGNATGGQYWNTLPGDIGYNLWLRQGTAFVNGPVDAQANISISLAPGSYTYDMFGEPGSSTGFDGLNLFFDGNDTQPGISAFGQTQTGSTPSTFAANSGNTLALNSSTVAGAGTLTYVNGATSIFLSNFTWAVPVVNNTDLVDPRSVTPSGQNDFAGSFTLTVQSSAVPEPGLITAFAFAGLGGLKLLVRRRSQ